MTGIRPPSCGTPRQLTKNEADVIPMCHLASVGCLFSIQYKWSTSAKIEITGVMKLVKTGLVCFFFYPQNSHLWSCKLQQKYKNLTKLVFAGRCHMLYINMQQDCNNLRGIFGHSFLQLYGLALKKIPRVQLYHGKYFQLNCGSE